MRRALGASRADIVRQLLTESTILSVAGAIAGLVIASWVSKGMLALAPSDAVRPGMGELSMPVFLFAAAVAVLTVLLFGLAPAISVSGLDLNGDGTINDVLPGTSWNELNRGVDEANLVGIVNEFNGNFAGGRTPTGQLIPPVTLPAQFQFGDTLYSQDLRLSRTFPLTERFTLLVLGEVFNVFNVANLSGYNFNLLELQSFGQPASRITQVFGSGGPRAFQIGARFNF